MKYDKLVRDKIPEIISAKGGRVVVHIADKKEYWKKLTEKLLEEVNELVKKPSVEEMADILEVIDAIFWHKKFGKKEVLKIQKEKAKKRGSFKKQIILEES